MSSTYDIIRQAILGRKNIQGSYNGFHRVMTPHTLGTKKGKEQCLCYQFAGESSKGTTFPVNSPANWRCITVEELENVAMIGGDLHTCTKHTKSQTCVDDIDVEMLF